MEGHAIGDAVQGEQDFGVVNGGVIFDSPMQDSAAPGPGFQLDE